MKSTFASPSGETAPPVALGSTPTGVQPPHTQRAVITHCSVIYYSITQIILNNANYSMKISQEGNVDVFLEDMLACSLKWGGGGEGGVWTFF